MELKTFVAETLTQIVEGVSEAQGRIRQLNVGAAVNPGAVDASSKRKIAPATAVDFDVAVLASEESSEQSGSAAKASLGLISVVTARTAAELDSRSAGGQRNETTSRIRFSVQLSQPADLHEYSYRPESGKVV